MNEMASSLMRLLKNHLASLICMVLLPFFPTVQAAAQAISLARLLDLRELLDLDSNACGRRTGIDHSVDLLALSDHHEMQLHRTERTPGDVDRQSSGAIRVHGISPVSTHLAPRFVAHLTWAKPEC